MRCSRPPPQFPFRLSRLLKDPHLSMTVAEVPDCMLDEWTLDMKAARPSLSGPDSMQKLRLVGQTAWRDISQVEARYALVRRLLKATSLQTRPQVLQYLSAEWYFLQARKRFQRFKRGIPASNADSPQVIGGRRALRKACSLRALHSCRAVCGGCVRPHLATDGCVGGAIGLEAEVCTGALATGRACSLFARVFSSLAHEQLRLVLGGVRSRWELRSSFCGGGMLYPENGNKSPVGRSLETLQIDNVVVFTPLAARVHEVLGEPDLSAPGAPFLVEGKKLVSAPNGDCHTTGCVAVASLERRLTINSFSSRDV